MKNLISKRSAIESRLSLRGKLKDRESGFTLIELLIVVVIIGVLTAIAVPAYISVVTNAQDSAAKQTISSVIAAQDLYYAGAGSGRDNISEGTYAASLTGGPAATTNTANSLAVTGLLSLDAGTAARTAMAVNTTKTVAVGVIAENGQAWVATTASPQPVKHAATTQAALQTYLATLTP